MDKTVKAVIFDMDGVILDTESICDYAWDIAGKEFGIEDGTNIQKLCLGTNKNDTRKIITDNLGKDFDVEGYLARCSEIFNEIEEEKGIGLMPYAKEILDYLKPQYKIALASSTRQVTVQRQLTNAGLIDYFENRICGDMVEHSKPNPDIYLKACQSIGEKPENCVAVEDSPNGIKSAVAAGMRIIMVPDRIAPTEELKPLCWKICSSLKDLKDFL